MMTVAAVVHDGSVPTDDLLLDAARRLIGDGVRLAGLVQENVRENVRENAYSDPGAAAGGVCDRMLAVDLASGRRIPISLDRGPGMTGCRLDTAGLAEAAALAAAAIRAGAEGGAGRRADLVIINKFSRQEAEGQGLRAEMALALTSGLPLLTSVNEKLLGDWSAFAGDDWTRLLPDAASVEAWCRSVLPRPAMRAAAV